MEGCACIHRHRHGCLAIFAWTFKNSHLNAILTFTLKPSLKFQTGSLRGVKKKITFYARLQFQTETGSDKDSIKCFYSGLFMSCIWFPVSSVTCWKPRYASSAQPHVTFVTYCVHARVLMDICNRCYKNKPALHSPQSSTELALNNASNSSSYTAHYSSNNKQPSQHKQKCLNKKSMLSLALLYLFIYLILVLSFSSKVPEPCFDRV